ncbi:MAG: hypothetical protein COT16_03540 [Elusimicrobia bacterium CG08_land_8_20_14_0_20_44_26]|nr:MAG: hypothetical protein COT16_03540 [Elusimicrobia bacterium CG08_land_8_20_14_0_20_44_26]
MTGKLPIPNVSINKLTVTVFSAIVLTTLMSCRECPTEPQNEGKDFALDYAGPSFVSLSFSISGSGKRNYAIQRDSLIVLTGTLFGEDTIVTDWNAEPATTYRYRLLVKDHGETIDKSEWLSVTTMDTTSHDFTWEKIVLCNGGGYLEDVEIVDENNVWVVGEFIPEPDTGGYSPNAAHWDGNSWTLKQIKYGATIYDILVFSDNDIWVSSGLPYHWDGQRWTLYHLWDMGVLSESDHPVYWMWGSSSSNMYFIGEGTVVHYDGKTFKKIEDIPDYNYYRINGIFDQVTNQTRIWIGAISIEVQGGALIYFDGQNWTTIWDRDNRYYPDPVYSTVGASWIPNNCKYLLFYIGGAVDGIFSIHNINIFDDYTYSVSVNLGAIRRIDGNGMNDFFAVGDFNNVIHYNGKTFHNYSELRGDSHSRYVSVAQKGDVVYIVESAGTIIYKGIR